MCSVLAGITALSGYMQYQSQQEAADAQARAYEQQAAAEQRNAEIENRKQEQIADNAARETEQLRSRQRIIAGQNRAQAGAAGLGMSGSPLDILSAGYDAYMQDKETALSNQRNSNYDSRVTESNYLNQAASHRAAASNVRDMARSQGIGTILGTAASIVGMGGFSGGGSAAPASTGGNAYGSVSSNIGNNTMATWNGGYTFSRINNYGKTLMPKRYF